MRERVLELIGSQTPHYLGILAIARCWADIRISIALLMKPPLLSGTNDRLRGRFRAILLKPMVRVSVAIVKEGYHSLHASRSNTIRFRPFLKLLPLDNRR